MGTDYMVLRGKTEYKAELSTSPIGCMTRLENLFNGIQSNIELLEERLEKYRIDMKQAEIEYNKPFQHEQELKEKLARQFELNNLLDLENKAVPKEQEVSQVAEQSYEYKAERKEIR